MSPEETRESVSNGVKSKKEKGPDKKSKGQAENLTSANVTTTNNYYINNNYYSSSEGLEHILGDSKTKQYRKSVYNNKLCRDNGGKIKETESSSKVTRIMNLVIVAVAIGLFLVSLIMQTHRAGAAERVDQSKEI